MYNGGWAKKKSDDYISRAFYKSQRDLFRFVTDINGEIGAGWYWNAGLGVLGYKIGPVNLDMINKGKKPENMLPLVLAQGSPIFHLSCEGKLGIALEWLQGQ